jgi:uncharacterized protein YjiS (DUF1127 family)
MTIAQQRQVAIRKRRRFMPMARAIVAIWRRRMSTRAALRELEPRLLADIGRTEKERRRECAKWFCNKTPRKNKPRTWRGFQIIGCR